jgi:predicted methyltransferase
MVMKSDRVLGVLALMLIACSRQSLPSSGEATGSRAAAAPSAKLDAVLSAQTDELKARYAARHPKETIEFFGIQTRDNRRRYVA